MAVKRRTGWFVRGFCALYALQVIIALYFHFVPMKRADFQGSRYEIHRGMGLAFGLIPLIGALGMVGPDAPVDLVITRPDGRKEVKNYDLPIDIYKEHPEVWPPGSR